MIAFPNAKINLGLHVTERRTDGYHNLETVFYPVELADVLEVLPGTVFSFESSGMVVDGEPGENLVVRAYKLLHNMYYLPPVRIHLHKAIPSGAGLGGGSSDAAFMLKTLNQLFDLSLSDEKLKDYADRLGADCPFFIENRPALASGTGDILKPLDLKLEDLYTVIIKPPFGVNTAAAYKAITPGRPAANLSLLCTEPVANWKDFLINDFEKPVFQMFPEISKIKEKLYQMGAIYASMSGSGSAVFGLFREKMQNIRTEFSHEHFVFC